MLNDSFNHLDTMTLAEFERSGFRLGDKMSNHLGEFIMSEADVSQTLLKGELVVSTTRFTVSNYADSGGLSAVTSTTDPKIYIDDAGATVEVNELAGLPIFIKDDSNHNYFALVKSNSAGASGSAMTIHLDRALPTTLGANPDIIVYDPNLCIVCPTGILKPACGVTVAAVTTPATIVAATERFFWRQVSGVVPIIAETTGVTPDRKVCPSSATAGYIEEATTTAADDNNHIGTALSTASTTDNLALIRLIPLG